MSTRLHTAVAVATTGILTTGLGLTLAPADAAVTTTHHDSLSQHRILDGHRPLSAPKLAALRGRQRTMLAQPGPARTLASAAAEAGAKIQKITVTTTEDSDLADPAGTRCIDAATSGCSLRAAVDAANNRKTAVQIVLGKHTYTLSTGAELLVTNPAGTSIVGGGSGRTTLAGAGSRVLNESPVDSDSRGPLLYLADLKVTDGSSVDGAGIYVGNDVANASLVLDGVSVTGNTATEYGGGIYTEDSANLYANRSSLSNNAAEYGGGLYTNSSDVNLTGVTINGNHAVDNAGTGGEGWTNVIGVGRMKGGSISGNTAGTAGSPGYGGGLWDSYGNLTFTGVHIDGNTTNGPGNGGGIYASFDLLEFNGGTISHNRAIGGDTSAGGGIYIDAGAQIDLHGVVLAGDKVAPTVAEGYGGGAIYDSGTLFANQLTIDRRSTIRGANNSAIYSFINAGHLDLEIDGSRLMDNSDVSGNGPDSSGCGGAVCLNGDRDSWANLTMTGDTVTGNTSAGNGGSGAVTAFAISLASTRVHLSGSVFTGNTTGAGGRGGAVRVSSDGDGSPDSLRSENNTFTGNSAGTPSLGGRGGAISIDGNAAFFDRGSTFTKNRARGSESWGGAVNSDGQQTSRFTGSTFTRNSASPSDLGHGGAVFTDDQGGTAFTRVTATHNRSGTYGGALDSSNSGHSVSVIASTISDNVAGDARISGAGGGIYVFQGVLTVENSTVTGNRAVQSTNETDVAFAGGIYVNGDTLGLRYSTVTGNIAPEGGGVYIDTRGADLLGSIVSANHKPSGGEQDCSTSVSQNVAHSLGGNLLGQKKCVTALQGADKITKHPRLAPLADNGGPTKTLALTKKSPAIGRGTFQCPSTDQRGRHRPAHQCDAGAFELPKVKKHHHHH